jgi:predicted enzyme related to lactoylglutathione lyase
MPTPHDTHGAFSWNELTTTDPKAARAFYERLGAELLSPGEMRP